MKNGTVSVFGEAIDRTAKERAHLIKLLQDSQREYLSDVVHNLSGFAAHGLVLTKENRKPGERHCFWQKTVDDCSECRLHSEHGTEPSFAVRNALVSLRSFGQWIGLND